MIILSHPTGNANVRAVANGLKGKGILLEFNTSIAAFPNNLWYKLGGVKGFADFRRRSFNPSLEAYTKCHPFQELMRLVSNKLGINFLIAHEKGNFSIDQVYRKFDVKVAKRLHSLKNKGAISVYAYEDGALNTFEKAKEDKLLCIYDLPIGYWKSARSLMQEEINNNSEWAATLTGFRDSQEKLNRKDQELALADVIFVASSFTKKTLELYNGKLPEIHVIPYGFPDIGPEKKYNDLKNNKLKVLFVGGLSQRKGISYLFEAVDLLDDKVELTVVGRKSVQNCQPLNTALEKCNWIPSLPHNEILKSMREHDVLVFPSLFEGFGLVITEAMSQGTPVITTNRTAGPDIIEHGIDGWIVESGSTSSIKNTLLNILNFPETLEKVGIEAQKKAKNRPWKKYSTELAEAVFNVKNII